MPLTSHVGTEANHRQARPVLPNLVASHLRVRTAPAPSQLQVCMPLTSHVGTEANHRQARPVLLPNLVGEELRVQGFDLPS